MPELKIKITKEAHEKLKELAKQDMRSLTNYITISLTRLANSQLIDINNMNTSTLPDGVTIKAKVQAPTPPKTPEEIEEEQLAAFQKLAKSILGQELDISDCVIFPDNTYFQYAQPPADGKFCRWPYTMPREKQIEYINEWKEILDNK